MRKGLIVLGIVMFMLLGCANDATNEEKKQLLAAFKKEGYLPNSLKLVGTSEIAEASLDASTRYVSLDVFESNGNYYTIDFDKIFVHSDKDKYRCDFVVKIYDDVKFLKNQEVTHSKYNSDTNRYEEYTTIEDIYKTNDYIVKKYCVNKEKKFIILETFVINEMN